MNKYGYIRVAAAYPKVELADPGVNSVRISDMIMSLSKKGARLIVFPELCLTGYTCGDLFNQPTLLNAAMRQLGFLQQVTKESHVTAVVGLPVRYRGRLYNCAAVIQYGEILGIVPKCYLPNYDEFYEKRWFSSGLKLDIPSGKEYNVIDFDGHRIPFGINLLFRIENAKFGVEICEDMWVPNPPSTTMSVAGADIIANLSATNEVIDKHAFLLSLIKERSSRCKCGYVYASAGAGESSTDLVFSGNAIIAEDGQILKKSDRFKRVEGYCIADIDVEKLRNTRQRQSSFGQNDIVLPTFGLEEFTATQAEPANLMREINPYPFLSSNKEKFEEQCAEIITIQAWGLEQRLLATHCKYLVVGVSGGLDSILPLLVAIRDVDDLGLDRKGIIGVTMPGFGTSDRTHNTTGGKIRYFTCSRYR